ncbi:MAG: hypothetical protein ABW208_02380 [Pyrinomonadaceae bacterium]
MSLTTCPDCRRLSLDKDESCPSCERAFRSGEPRAQAAAEERAFGRRNNSLFAALFLITMAVLTFVVLRGT